jgi:hypothetical protein
LIHRPKVEQYFKDWGKDKPVSKEEGALRPALSEANYSQILASTKEVRGFTGHVCWTPPMEVAVHGMQDSLESITAIAKHHFWNQKDGCPEAPSLWPRQYNIPIKVFSSEHLPRQGEWHRYGFDGLVKAFWFAVSEVVNMIESAKRKNDAESRKASESILTRFRTLARNVLYDVRWFADEGEALVAAAQLMETAEEMREHFGFTGFKKILITKEFVASLKKQNNGTDPTFEEVAKFMNEHIKWSDASQAPSSNNVRDFLKIAKEFDGNPGASAAVQAAQALYGRRTIFDEYSKLLVLCNRASTKQDLAWLCEWIYVGMKRQSGEPDKASLAELKNKAGDVSIALVTRRIVHHLLDKFCPQDEARLLTMFKSPTQWDRTFPSQSTGAKGSRNSIQESLIAASKLIRKLSQFLNQLMDGAHKSQLKGLLASPPPGGVTVEKCLGLPGMKPLVEEIETEHAACSSQPDTASQVENAIEAESLAQDSIGGEDDKDSKGKLLSDAAKLATDFMATRVVIMSPEADTQEALKLCLAGQICNMTGRMVAYFDTKCDDEARVLENASKTNHFRLTPPVNSERLNRFCDAMDSVMAEGRDFVVIAEGRGRSGGRIVDACINRLKWQSRALILNYDINMMGQLQVAKKMRSFGCGASSESLLICWKGKVPKVTVKQHKYVDPGSATHWNTLNHVPVVLPEGLAQVPVMKKNQVLVNSSWDGKSLRDGCDVGQSDSESAGEVVADSSRKRKYTKRGRTLLRTPSTDEVPLFHHPPHPNLVKELAWMLQASWMILGTPEGGSACKALMELDIACLCIARNPEHQQVLNKILVDTLAHDFCTPGHALSMKALTERLSNLQDSASEAESGSQSDEGCDAESGAETENQGDDSSSGKKKRKQKKAKDKKKTSQDKKHKKSKDKKSKRKSHK